MHQTEGGWAWLSVYFIWWYTCTFSIRNLHLNWNFNWCPWPVAGRFLLAWLPYTILSLWTVLGDSKDVSPIAQTFPALFAKLSVVWNPLVHMIRAKKFRKELQGCFRIADRHVETVPMSGNPVDLDRVLNLQRHVDFSRTVTNQRIQTITVTSSEVECQISQGGSDRHSRIFYVPRSAYV